MLEVPLVNIHFLKTFVSLARTKSFRAAARENSVTQSAVSQQIRTLESRVGKELVERSGKTLALTPAGQIFLKYAENIVNQYEEAVHQVQGENEDMNGAVRISTIYSIGLYRLQPLIKKFLRKHRQINVHLEYHHNNVIYERVQNNIDDFGVVAFPKDGGRIVSSVLGRDDMVLIQDPARPQFSKKTVTPNDLNKARYVALSRTTPTGRETYHQLKALGLDISPVAEFENVETLKSAVLVGMGCAIVPKNILAAELKNKSFEIIKLPKLNLSRPVGVIHSADRSETRARRLFLEMLAENSRSG